MLRVIFCESLLMYFLNKISTIASESFLPDRLVMLDCEMTGVLPKRDHLLQIAALKLEREGICYKQVEESFVLYLAYAGRPSNEFHRKYLTHIFDQCNKSTISPPEAKKLLHDWLGDWRGHVTPTGDCVPTDIAFLLEKGCADPSDIDVPGTFHFEFFEMNPLKLVARHLLRSKFETPGLNKEGIHDALVDCGNQLLELNHILAILLGDFHG